MKTKQSILVILVFSVIFSFGAMSCRSGKTAVSCPEISIKKSDYRAHRKVKNSRQLLSNNTRYKSQNIHRSKKIQKGEINPVTAGVTNNRNIEISKSEFTKGLTASTDNISHPLIYNAPMPLLPVEYNSSGNNQDNSNIQEVKCDTIILKSGAVITGKVEEIGQTELKYKRCDNLTGPLISLLNSNVSKILYSNGTSELFGPKEMYIPNNTYFPDQTNFSNNNSAPLKTEGLGLAGFISGLAGLFIAAIPLGIVAIVFGAISLSKIKRNPQRYKGKGFAIASIILGIVDVVAMFLILASM